jgi:magnesium transporter
MLTVYRDEAGSLRESASLDLPSEVIWIDLFKPTDDEEAFVESRTHIRVPSAEALGEIEATSRLHVDHGVMVLSR